MMLTRNMCIAYDITDPTPWEDSYTNEDDEKAHDILDGKRCPICRQRMKSDEYVICGSFPSDWENKYTFFAHSRCLTDEMSEALEKIAGYTMVEDLGEAME